MTYRTTPRPTSSPRIGVRLCAILARDVCGSKSVPAVSFNAQGLVLGKPKLIRLSEQANGQVVDGLAGDPSAATACPADILYAEIPAVKSTAGNLDMTMTLALLFWIIAIVAIVFGAWGYTNPQASRWAPWPVFILVLILGFAEFGFRLTR